MARDQREAEASLSNSCSGHPSGALGFGPQGPPPPPPPRSVPGSICFSFCYPLDLICFLNLF